MGTTGGVHGLNIDQTTPVYTLLALQHGAARKKQVRRLTDQVNISEPITSARNGTK